MSRHGGRLVPGLCAVLLASCGPKHHASNDGAAVGPSTDPTRARDASAPNDAASASLDSGNSDAEGASRDPTTRDLPLFYADKPPETLGALEASLRLHFDDAWIKSNGMGFFAAPPISVKNPAALSEDVVRVFADYGWDQYHERRIASMDVLRAKSLESFAIDFPRGRAAREAIFRARFGSPTTVRETLTSPPGYVVEHRVYGPYYVSISRPINAGSDSEAFRLEWYKTTPDWAVPAISRESRERFFRQLGTSLAKAKTYPDVVALVSSPPNDAGIVTKGSLNKDDYWLELKPPMSAMQLAKVFGWKNAIGESVGVHREKWRIVLSTGSNKYGPTTKEPSAGAWEIEASLDGWPSGAALAGSGPTGRRRLGAKDVVRHVRIHPGD